MYSISSAVKSGKKAFGIEYDFGIAKSKIYPGKSMNARIALLLFPNR